MLAPDSGVVIPQMKPAKAYYTRLWSYFSFPPAVGGFITISLFCCVERSSDLNSSRFFIILELSVFVKDFFILLSKFSENYTAMFSRASLRREGEVFNVLKSYY